MSSNNYDYKQILNSYMIQNCNNLYLKLDWTLTNARYTFEDAFKNVDF